MTWIATRINTPVVEKEKNPEENQRLDQSSAPSKGKASVDESENEEDLYAWLDNVISQTTKMKLIKS